MELYINMKKCNYIYIYTYIHTCIYILYNYRYVTNKRRELYLPHMRISDQYLDILLDKREIWGTIDQT